MTKQKDPRNQTQGSLYTGFWKKHVLQKHNHKKGELTKKTQQDKKGENTNTSHSDTVIETQTRMEVP
jgi:hypothetical protein